MRSRITAAVLGAVILAGAYGVGGGDPPPPDPPPPGTANYWVDLNGGTCTRQAVAGSYVDAQACGSLDAAYDAATPGDTVLVKAGNYSGTITGYVKTGFVSIAAAPGETVTAPDFLIQAQYVRLTGIKFQNTANDLRILSGSGSRTSSRTHHVELIDFGSGQHGFITADDVLLKQGSMGGFDACTTDGGTEDVLQMWLDGPIDSERITVEQMTFHDLTQSSPGCFGFHSDCIQSLDGNNIVVKQSVFTRCYGEDFIIRSYSTTGVGPVTIENSYLGPSLTGEASTLCNQGEDNCTGNFILRNNTIQTQFGHFTNTPGSSLTMTGNVCKIPAFDCTPGGGVGTQTLSYNTFTSGSAGTNAVTCTPTFLADGYHLAPSDTCAKGRGNPANFPALDIDGETRPMGAAAPDAGADEVT